MKFIGVILYLTHLVGLVRSRVVGAVSISIERAPYHISLEWDRRYQCGGAIVAVNYVVTTSHCVLDREPAELRIRAGTSNRYRGGQKIRVKTINMHPLFKFNMISLPDYDIAVLKLVRNLILGLTVAAIQLPKHDQTWAIGTKAVVSGWGPVSHVELQSAVVEFVDFESCSKAYNNWMTPRMFCAAGYEVGAETCQFDSGNPLQIDRSLVGIVLYGHGCASPDYPGVYINIFSVLDFIQNFTGHVPLRSTCE